MFIQPLNGQAEPNQTYEKDLSTVDEVMTPINLTQNHDDFVNNLKLRLTKLEVTPSATSLRPNVRYQFVFILSFSYVSLH
jgi:hypothetical protein